ncbi:MAG TPA: F0F1 ATP synthase subunit A [Candidatus Peribacteria bacterium]|nr:F0F1 ATP synthase subunit A [Candidatus Peribacteria bacterium]
MKPLSISLASEVIAHIGPVDIRNTMFMAWLVVLVLCAVAGFLTWNGFKQIPGRVQAATELVVMGLYDLFASILHDERLARKFFPMISTMMIFIVLGNWMGILPGIGSVTVKVMHEGAPETVPLLRSMNADVNMTLAIALAAMFMIQLYGMLELGIGKYASKFFVPPWKNPIGTFVGFLEIISELSRVISFTFRLFGNIFAGEVLLIVISYLVPYIAPVPFLGMELFVGLIQGIVFALLTTVFLKIAVSHHDDHHEEPPAAPAPALA